MTLTSKYESKLIPNPLIRRVIGCAIEVHRILGPGLLESTYEQCLRKELEFAQIAFNAQLPIDFLYKNSPIDCGFRIDLLIEKELIVEIKAADNLQPIHESQILTYMRLSKIRHGLLINFNTQLLSQGIKKFIMC